MTSYIRGSDNFTDEHSRIIQVASEVFTTEMSQTLSTTIFSAVGDIKKTITTIEDNSKFLVYARWFGEVAGAWDVMFSIRFNGVAMNGSGTSTGQGITVPAQSHTASDNNDSTPEVLSVRILAEPKLPAGTVVNIDLAAVAHSSRTIWTNRLHNASTDTNYERGTSELIIQEVK